MMKSCAKWKMTKFDIFVVNLGRSADRREAMKRKIAEIRGFKAIYIDGEKVADTTFRHTERSEVSKSREFQTNNELMTQERIDESYRFAKSKQIVSDSNVSKMDSSPTAQNDESPTLSLQGRIVDSPEAIQKNQMDCHENSLRSFSRNDDNIKNANSSIVSEKSGLCSCERGNRTNGSLTKRTTNLPDLSPQDEFAESTLHFHFFPATDATKFKNGESPLPPQYSSKLTRFVKGKDLSFGEIACFSSHYRLWQKCVEVDSPIIILEDDIDFMQDFCQIVDIFKSPFEYVRLYYLFDRKITHLYDNLYISFGRTAGTQGYYLTPQAAQKFIKNARFWLFCVDDYMDMFFIHSVKNIIFKPFIISEDSLSAENSTILGREKPKMRFYQKLTRELSRIYFFVIRKYVYFALSFLRNLGVELRAFFRTHKVAH